MNHHDVAKPLSHEKSPETLANIAQGLESCLYMGNLDARRDWGYAKDYVKMQWLMLQQDSPEDFVIATGKQQSVRGVVRMAASEIGVILNFENTGINEVATVLEVDRMRAPSNNFAAR